MTDIFKALSDENRLRILYLLSKESLCVCELEACLNMKQSNLSRHLASLKQAGIIEGYRVAQWIHYRIRESFKDKHAQLWSYIVMQAQENYHELDQRYLEYKELAKQCGIDLNQPSRIDIQQQTQSFTR
jgi:ArsR family transcriptional regulator, arsenate/arsenite/antimonite-responsive transcriptional repressor